MIGVPSYHAIAAMGITIAMFIAFARGRMSVEIISLMTIAVIAVGLYFFPLDDTQPIDGLSLAFSGFGHYALITICALMIMGRGLVVTGALDPAARFLERLFKINLQLGLLFSLVVTFLLSMGVNNTPVLVLLMPIFVQLAMRGAMAASKTLIPLNAASLMGGMATTIGTSTNILVVSIAVDLGMPEMGVFHFTPIVLIASLVALPFVWIVMPRMLGDNRIETVHAQRLFETRLRVTEDSILNGRQLSELQSRLPAGIEFHDVPVGLLRPQHRLRMTGTHEAIEEAMARVMSYAQLLYAAGHGANLLIAAMAGIGQQPGQRRFSGAGRAIKQYGPQSIRIQQSPQQLACSQEMTLANKLIQRARSHACGQWLHTIEIMLFRLGEEVGIRHEGSHVALTCHLKINDAGRWRPLEDESETYPAARTRDPSPIFG